jgi:hypothetical protein
MRIMFLKS